MKLHQYPKCPHCRRIMKDIGTGGTDHWTKYYECVCGNFHRCIIEY